MKHAHRMGKGRAVALAGAVLAGGLLTGTISGCASPWEQSFEAATPEAFPASERVVIREVPWERIDALLTEINERRAASDIHPDEWSDEQIAAEKERLVRALQLSESPDQLEILGRSVFKSTANVELLDGSLSSFARSIGADYAIWSNANLGPTETVEREAVTRRGYTWRRYHRRDGHLDYDYLPYNETLYVPVVVERDQVAWVVYYVRVLDG